MPKKSAKQRKEIEHRLIAAQTSLAALMAEQELLERDLTRNLHQELLESAKGSFKSFVTQAWGLVDQGSAFVDAWYLDCICDHLEAVARKEILNLIVQIPPRHSKSTLCSALFPAWVWLNNPSEEFITASATQRLVIRDAVRSRDLMQSEWYQSLKPDFEFMKDQNQQSKYTNNKGGTRLATSVGGTLTGFGYTIGILDDILKADDAYSKNKIESTLEWWRTAFLSRRNSPEARTVIIMQRLAENDPIGWELAQSEELWDNICLPIMYEEGRKFYSSLGWEDIRKEPGELLSPDRFPKKEVESIKKRMGDMGFASQYQQNPTPREGNIVKKPWIRYYMQPFNKFQLPQFEIILGSWDLSFSEAGGSYSVGQVWGKRGTQKYLLHQYRAKMGVIEQLKTIRQMKAEFPGIRALLVEKKANGDAVLQMLQKEIPGLIAISPQEIGAGDKEVRLAACSIEFEANQVFFPHESFAPWVKELVQELTTFPRATNDDQVDALSQALNWLSTKSGLSSINVTATAEQLKHETGLGKDFDHIRRKTEKELQEKTSAKMITEASSSNMNSLRSIFS